MSVVRKFADPVTSLLDQLNESIEEAAEDEKEKKEGLKEEHRTSNVEWEKMKKQI
jgi:hypothetical protein